MGSLTSRQNVDQEEADISSNHTYKYPPKSGNYFASHFIMGGERFDAPQPEAYLFGENADLNFLGSRPSAFPYPQPQANEPTKTLKSLVNIRKESVRFSKVLENPNKLTEPITVEDVSTVAKNSYNIEFVYDADAKFAVTIYYLCTEDCSTAGLSYVSRDPSLTSETYQCKRGVNQLFSQSSHIFNPSAYSDDELGYHSERGIFPVAIHCVVEDGPAAEETKQSHTTICVVDHHTDGTFVLRALKQKIYVDGLCYLLQEIYGIENKNINKASIDDDTDDNGSECVICMCDTRDTLILPCRHLCLCNSCADSLRYQANNCPICRAPFRALLQIKAVQKSGSVALNGLTSVQNPQEVENIPSGFSSVSLIEALNGPPHVTIRNPNRQDGAGDNNIDDTDAAQAAEILNRGSIDPQSTSKLNGAKDKSIVNSSEILMSVLLSNKSDGDQNVVSKSSAVSSKPLHDKSPRPHAQSKLQQNRDKVKIVNEKNAANLKNHEIDDDSDAEKLSPLLVKESNKQLTQDMALNIDEVHESIDDAETDGDEQVVNNFDIDKSKDVTRAPSSLASIKDNLIPLPDSPISGSSTTSTRSSGDSYSSSSSTRQLLSTLDVNCATSNNPNRQQMERKSSSSDTNA